MRIPDINLRIRGLIFLLSIIVSLMACEKFNRDDILGTWISSDLSDTLEFVDNSNFYKSTVNMRHDHYDYNLEKDSIELRYNGTLMILVQPTKHLYELNENSLILDLTNTECYGFNSERIVYLKE
jgi:hypothetical protein